MTDTTKKTEYDLEAEIEERRKKEERADSGEMIGNFLVLVALLLGFLFMWNLWGESGFKHAYERVRNFAEEQADEGARMAPTLLPAFPVAAASAASTKPSSPASAPGDKTSASDIVAAVGQSGDAYGGANALFSALVASFAAWAGYMQFRTLRRAQRAYQDQIDENRREKHARKTEERDRQEAQFESHFFQLLNLAREARERIATTKTGPSKEPKAGAAALDAFANTICREVCDAANAQPPIPVSARQLTFHYQAIYGRRPSALGPYFRLLFQTFKFISKSEVRPALKLQCARIARGQMSDGSVLLLALNGMSLEGYNFVEYIEEFGLLEHMLDKYIDKFGVHLREAYRPRAFMGSNDREAAENAHNPIPEFSANRFHWTIDDLNARSGMKTHPYIGVGDDLKD